MSEPTPDWSVIAAARRQMREECRRLRANVGLEVRQQAVARVREFLCQLLDLREQAGLPPPCIAGYWPIRGELSLLPLLGWLVERGLPVALPEVVAAEQPLLFRRWTPDARMEPGIWRIPVPVAGEVLDPELLLVPLVGYDDAGYRLGNGGGYYDRTLASRQPRPRAVGIGFRCLRLPELHPQPHDIPMDLILTEAPLSVNCIGRGWLPAG